MNTLDTIIKYNERFVFDEEYRNYETATKYPMKKMVVLSCMDTRLVELLPRAMNIHNGDVKIIKVAGAVVNHPFGSVMRSIIVAVHDLEAEEIFVVGHEDCGMSAIQPEKLIKEMIDDGIPQETITLLENSGLDIEKWLQGFGDVDESVTHSVSLIKNHPLIPDYVKVSGLVINPQTGKLKIVVDGFKD